MFYFAKVGLKKVLRFVVFDSLRDGIPCLILDGATLREATLLLSW
jgi:hypothetical protein